MSYFSKTGANPDAIYVGDKVEFVANQAPWARIGSTGEVTSLQVDSSLSNDFRTRCVMVRIDETGNTIGIRIEDAHRIIKRLSPERIFQLNDSVEFTHEYVDSTAYGDFVIKAGEIGRITGKFTKWMSRYYEIRLEKTTPTRTAVGNCVTFRSDVMENWVRPYSVAAGLKELYDEVPQIVNAAMEKVVKEVEQEASDSSEVAEEIQNDVINSSKDVIGGNVGDNREADRRDWLNNMKDRAQSEAVMSSKERDRLTNSLLVFIAEELVSGFERLDHPRIVKSPTYPGPPTGIRHGQVGAEFPPIKPPSVSEMREMTIDEIVAQSKSIPSADEIQSAQVIPERMELAEVLYNASIQTIHNPETIMIFDKGPWKHMTSMQKMHWYKVASHALEEDEDKLNKAWRELLNR